MADHRQPDQLVHAGWAFYNAGNQLAAMRDFRAALVMDPDHAGALAGLTQAQIATGELDEADKTAQHLLKVAPNLGDSHRIQAEVLRRRGLSAGAEEYVRESIRLAPNDPFGYHILGAIQFDQKLYGKALRTVTKARELSPDFAALAAQQAQILLYSRGAKAAQSAALEALRIRDDSHYVLINVARVFLMGGKLVAASHLLREILQRDANDEEAISLFLLTEGKRYRLLRWHVQLLFWRNSHGFLGWVTWLGVWGVILAAIVVLAISFKLPAIFLVIGYKLFWDWQYARHREQVKKHFARPKLAPGF